MKNMLSNLCALITVLFYIEFHAQTVKYAMPEENYEHEGTWLQWPHNYLFGNNYRDYVEPTWIAMTSALQSGEKVHIIAYDSNEQSHIISVLNNAGIPLTNIDFYIHQTDDVWIRDNGPIFVFDQNYYLHILDWGFNGWGDDAPYSKCDVIPKRVSEDINIPWIDLSAMILEGGAVEHDGKGTMMATRSSITHSSRNPALTESQIEEYLTTNMGIRKFIWLDGLYGSEITDMHIDGVMKFANDSTIVSMNNIDLLYWELSQSDIDILYSATDINNKPYNFVYIPLTQNNVKTTDGRNIGDKGAYTNFYIANEVVLVPTYNDPNDADALNIIQDIYPNRTVVGIDVRNLYLFGGMVHCVTMQQPAAPLKLKIKVFLEGSYQGSNLMNTYLPALEDFPKNQPYNDTPWNYNGFEQVTTVPSNVVDWIMIELRDEFDESSVISKRAAFLLNNGNVIGTDGSSPLLMIAPEGNYYISVIHRNHLPIMSKDPISLNSTTAVLYDFTTGSD
jgi:agmatine deiminase